MNDELARITGGSSPMPFNPGGFRGRREERAAELEAYLTGRRGELVDANRDAAKDREHAARVKEMARITERTRVGLDCIKMVVDYAVHTIDGDEGLAHYSARIVQRHSDQITDLV